MTVVDVGDRDGPGLMTQAARLYFDRQLSKVEIAAALGISRFRVARLIAQALDSGLVRVEYRDTPAPDRELAAALEARFGIDLCVVAEGAADRDGVARLAASIVDGLVGPGDVVGIAWGSTLAAVVAAMPARRDPSIAVVQLAGSSAGYGLDRDAAELTRLLADRWGATRHPLFAPAFVDKPALRRALLREPEVAATADRYPSLTMAVIGIGALGPDGADGSSLARSGALPPETVAALLERGVVGDLLIHPLTVEGAFPATDLAARAIGITVEGLRAVPRVVAVAAGRAKGRAIRGALRSGIVDILVTDAPAATAVLEVDDDIGPAAPPPLRPAGSRR